MDGSDLLHHPCRHQRRAERRVAGRQPLGEHDDVGQRVGVVVGGEEAPGPEGAHALVEDEPDAVAIADGAGPARERGVGHVDPRGLASDRLHDQGQHPPRPDPLDGLLQGGQALRRRLLGTGGPEGQRSRDLVRADRHRAPEGGHAEVAVQAEGLEGGAVIAGHQRDHPVALRLAGGERMGTEELEGHLDRLGASGGEVGALEAGPGQRGEPLGEGGVGEMPGGARVGVGQPPSLLQHRPEHPLVALTESGQEGPRADVEEAPSSIVDEVDALPRHDRGQRAGRGAVEEDILGATRLRVPPACHRALRPSAAAEHGGALVPRRGLEPLRACAH